MFYGCYKVVNCIMPAPGIQGIRICNKRFCSGCPDLFYYLPDKDRVDVAIIPVLPEMDLDCSQVVYAQ
jgi:hypothetical protein